jgi:hypothetical protein
MARLQIKHDTYRALFAKSGNVCAFPGCNEEMVTDDEKFIGQLCHIEAAEPGGQRFNIASNDEERRSFENLMLMCYKHHRETDDVATYDVDLLKKIKREHEALRGQKPFKINEAFLYKIEAQMEEYWALVSDANTNSHVIPELAVHISTQTPPSQQFSEIHRAMNRLFEFLNDLCERDRCLNDEIRKHLLSLGYDLTAYDALPYYENPFSNRNWEIHSLAITNTRTDLSIAVDLAEIRFLEEYVKTHPTDTLALKKLDAAKNALRKTAASVGYVD